MVAVAWARWKECAGGAQRTCDSSLMNVRSKIHHGRSSFAVVFVVRLAGLAWRRPLFNWLLLKCTQNNHVVGNACRPWPRMHSANANAVPVFLEVRNERRPRLDHHQDHCESGSCLPFLLFFHLLRLHHRDVPEMNIGESLWLVSSPPARACVMLASSSLE